MPGPLGLADADFWDAPRRTEDDVHARLIAEDFRGVVIDAPARVPLGRRATLPLSGVHVATVREGQTLSLDEAAVATAARLETHEVRAGLAFPQKDLAPAAGLDDDDDPGDALTLVSFEADLRAQLGVPWQPGTWLLTLLVRDQATNRVTVKLEAGGAGGFKDPAVAALMAGQRRPRYPQPVWPRQRPGKALPTYRARPDSPPVPGAPGIALSVGRLLRGSDDAQVVLRGSFRLPVLEREVVKPADPTDAAALERLDEQARADALREGLAWQDPGDPDAAAVVSITLVSTGASRAGPLVLHLQVPTYEPIDPTADAPEAVGHFALDLLAQPGGERLRDQTSFIYALCGPVLAGPATVAVVDPRLLP